MVDPGKSERRGRVLLTVVICLLLAGGAAGASWMIFASEPTAQQEGATRRSAALVETVAVERGTHRPRFRVLGRVEPAREVVLSPRVSGQVVALEPNLVPGGIVRAGEPLLRIDPADFERALTSARSALHQVEAELAIEEGRQQAARQEFDLLGEEIRPENRALVLREPQIASARARVQAATADVEQAQLDLDRATVTAPFDAQVLERSVNVGSQVSPGEALAHLVGVDEYWVVATLPPRDLRWLVFGDDDDPGAPVHVRHATAWPPGAKREGRLDRLIGAVDDETRLARVLVTVPDPLGRAATDDVELPPLILGTIVEVEIEGRPLVDVARIDRDLLRQNETVWVMKEGVLEVREVELVFRDEAYAYLGDGIEAGEELVVTNLATVTDGLSLRRVEDSTPEAGAASEPSAEGAP